MSRDLTLALPTLVGKRELPGPRQPRVHLGAIALHLAPTDRLQLRLIGAHPFLTASELAAVLGVTPVHARARRLRLIELGLVRLLGGEEVGEQRAECKLAELTLLGLKLVAASLGLPPGQAIETHGLVGGGPDYPFGTRPNLVRYLDHTLGVNRAFANLYLAARVIGERIDGGAELVVWDNAAVCARAGCRPDGYGLLRFGQGHLRFYLEYDRGTMSARDYRHKFGAYLQYKHYRQNRWGDRSFPAILVVAASPSAEERIAKVVGSDEYAELSVYLTIERLGDPAVNTEGLLGPIWRLAQDPSRHRRRWPRASERAVRLRERRLALCTNSATDDPTQSVTKNT